VLGLSAAYELGRRGHDVVCLEQSAIGHARSGSKSESRLLRLSHDDPFYVCLASRSLAGWESLQAEAGEQLLQPTTLLIFGDQMSRFTGAMAVAGASARIASRAELSQQFDGFAFATLGAFEGEAFVEDTARIMLASQILPALASLAHADIRQQEPVARITETADHVGVETSLVTYRCDCVVICAGAWSAQLARIARHLQMSA
jgi:glycine/D-amino acid oxidase-like deaminating enzyme